MRNVFCSCLSAAVIATGLLTVSPMTANAGQKCRPDGHLHYGASDSMPTRMAARRSAIEAWGSFVALEYGRSWANFRNARLKVMSCQTDEAGWSCNVEANPCRANRIRSVRK